MAKVDLSSLQGGLIVSVQAPEASPMRDPEVIAVACSTPPTST